MRGNPERIAWTVLGAAFLCFCVLAVGIPLGTRSYLLNATRDHDTRLQVIEGPVLVQQELGGNPTAVTRSAGLAPGPEVITDSRSWATLDFFDRSHVTLYSNTTVRLDRVQSPRFGVSRRPNQITLGLTGGLLRVGKALANSRETEFRVLTPHAGIELEEGSYRIEVSNQGTLVTVVRGQAEVSRDETRVPLGQGTRLWVDVGGTVGEPISAARNLLTNGDFQEPLASGWVTSTVVLASTVEPPAIEVVQDGGRRAVRLVRREGDAGNHTEATFHQSLSQNVRDFSRLVISLDVKLDFQSLSGGGLQSSEFPIIVRLDWKDRWGNDRFWTHGFFYTNSDSYAIGHNQWGQLSGEQIPQGVWYPYESGNLFELLGDSQPVQVTGLTVYASGWNYDSLVSEIQLIVE